ncbi:MAG: response regulator [Bacteroidales bacterium]|nr:response regulator [Bacteroidales bacterium]MBN2820385.1 response regulator [Bacteroidales bacterium]
MRRIIELIVPKLLIAFLIFDIAQAADLSKDVKQIVNTSEKRITFQTLPENFDYNGVRDILSDHKGFLWFATIDGLIRFDGINLFLYEHSDLDSNSLLNNEVNALAEDAYGNLWIGTSKGLNLYNREMDNFSDVSRQAAQLMELSDTYISDISVDSNSMLWISTYGNNFYVLNSANHEIRSYIPIKNYPGEFLSKGITRIAIHNEKVWIGTRDGLFLFQPSDTSFKYFCSNPEVPYSLSNNYILSMAINKQGELWIGTRGGGLNLLIEQDGKYSFRRYLSDNKSGSLSNNVILSITEAHNGDMWFGTENGGLNRLSRKEERFEIYRVEEASDNSLNSNSIWSLYTDKEGRIWIGTVDKGINVIDEKYNKFDSFKKNPIKPGKSLPHNNVRSFSETENGKIWIGTDGGGVCLFDPKTHEFSQQIYNSEKYNCLKNNAVQSVLYDENKYLWIALWGSGVDRLDIKNNKIEHFVLNTEETEASNVRVLYKDSQNNLWAGSSGKGLFKFNEKQNAFETVRSSNSCDAITGKSFVSCMLEDKNHTYWVGTLHGLFRIKYGKNQILTCEEINPSADSNSYSRHAYHVIFKDTKERIWAGTADDGIYLISGDNNIIQSIDKQDGLLSNTIFGILEDDKGYLWITTNRGMTRFHPDSMSFRSFTREDGLNSNEFYPNSCLRTSSGRFFIGGENGFNMFYPGEIIKNKTKPVVQLSDFKIGNVSAKINVKGSPLKKHITETDEIILNHKQSSFTIEFVALNYTRPKKNQFKYKLEGLEENWINAGNNRSANYTNIGPGNYVFLIKGSNNDGVWSDEPLRLKITVRPPVWKTHWAYFFYLVLISSISILGLKIWQERSRIKNQLLLEKMAKEQEHEMNERNIQYFTNISHEFRTPLSLIIGPLENLIQSATFSLKDQLQVIQRNANRLMYLTNNLMNFRKFEEGGLKLNVQEGDILNCLKDISNYFTIRIRRRKLILSVDSNENSIIGWFDPEKMETILLNLLSNAIKFSHDGGLIKIDINAHDQSSMIKNFNYTNINELAASKYLELKITDSGTGISSEELPHIFDKFYQAKNSANNRQVGTGIGLSLTKGLVELHHGNIWVDSELGMGTSFTVFIPIERSSYADHEVTGNSIDKIGKSIMSPHNELTIEEATGTNSGEKTGERPDILVVEDNDDLRLFLARELGNIYNVKQAEDGAYGIDMALNLVPDLIITDVLMPRLSGFELCKAIKSDIRTSHIPIILLTAKSAIHDQIEGFEQGADVYLTKPFSMELLHTQINHLIQSRRKLYAQFSHDVYLIPSKLSENVMDQQFLQRIIDFVLQNIYDEKINVEGLATEMNLNRSNIYRKIKALTGDSVVEFIRTIRLKQAIKLMETRKFSLAEIAYQTGFTSPSYFTKMFKRKYGKTPSEYIDS